MKSKNPKILTFVTRFLGQKVAGLESQIFNEFILLSKFLAFTIITEQATQEKFENISIKQIPQISVPKLRGFLNIFQHLYFTFKLRNEYDLVYVRTFSLPELISGVFAKKFLKKPLLLLVPGSWILVGKSVKVRILRFIFRMALRNADSIVFYSKLIIPEISNLVGKFDERKVVIIRNAVDTKKFLPDQGHTSKNLLYVGRIHPLKHIEDIISALPIVTKEFSEVKLNIVGSISNEEYFEQLQKLVAKLNCKEKVNFLGPIPHEEIYEHFFNCKIFIFMGENEGIPRAILEAMSCGKPVIAPPNSGIPDVISDRVNGFLVENNYPKKLAEKIIFLLSNEGIQQKIGVEARRTIEEEFTWDIFTKDLVKTLYNTFEGYHTV